MKQIIHTDNAPAAIGAYSQAIRVNNHVYLSGQIPLNPQTGELISDNFTEQAIQVFKNLHAVIEAAGASLHHLVKINAYLTDLSYFSEFNDVMSQFIPEPFPARAAVGVMSLPKGALVEVEAIVYIE